MEGWKLVFLIGGVVLFAIGVQLFARNKRPVKSAFAAIVRGVLALLAVHITGIFTQIALPMNLATVCWSGAAGIPGVIALLLVNLILPAA